MINISPLFFYDFTKLHSLVQSSQVAIADKVSKHTLTIELNDINAAVTKELKKIRKQGDFRGFRKGQVPLSYLKKRFGSEILKEVLPDQVKETFTKYVEDNNIAHHIYQEYRKNSAKIDGASLKDWNDLELEYLFAEINKIDFEKFESTDQVLYRSVAGEEDIDLLINDLRNRQASLQPTDVLEEDGRLVTIALPIDDDGKLIEGSSAISKEFFLNKAMVGEDNWGDLIGITEGQAIEVNDIGKLRQGNLDFFFNVTKPEEGSAFADELEDELSVKILNDGDFDKFVEEEEAEDTELIEAVEEEEVAEEEEEDEVEETPEIEQTPFMPYTRKYRLQVKAIEKKVPAELNEEFYGKYFPAVTTEEEFRVEIAEFKEGESEQRGKIFYTDRTMKTLQEDNNIELSNEFLKEAFKELVTDEGKKDAFEKAEVETWEDFWGTEVANENLKGLEDEYIGQHMTPEVAKQYDVNVEQEELMKTMDDRIREEYYQNFMYLPEQLRNYKAFSQYMYGNMKFVNETVDAIMKTKITNILLEKLSPKVEMIPEKEYNVMVKEFYNVKEEEQVA